MRQISLIVDVRMSEKVVRVGECRSVTLVQNEDSIGEELPAV
jgi:hypothetical protein